MTSKSNFWEQLKPHFLVLAPMEGVTDKVFRQVVSRAGRPEVFFTEFTNVSSYASQMGRNNALERLEIVVGEEPIVAQIWGKNPEHFSQLAREIIRLGFQGLDINMGCPDRHVNKAGGGAAMIRTPDLAVECIKKAKEATGLPVSVKTRLGFSYIDEHKNWLSLLLEQDLAALTVHLRTRKEMSKVDAHFELIPEILRMREMIAPRTKLIFNGDILDRSRAEELFEKYPQIDGLMIGRGVFYNPFCFTKHQPRPKELIELLLFHLELFDERAKELALRGSHYPFQPLKRFLKIYLREFKGAGELRTKCMESKNVEEIRMLVEDSMASFETIE